jgi:hypothetical protein
VSDQESMKILKRLMTIMDSMYLFSEETEDTDDHHGLPEFIF